VLQPVHVRRVFRVLAAPLALGFIAVSIVAARFAVEGVRRGEWLWLLMLVTAIGFGVIGALGLVLAATGALPEWVVGDGRDDEDPPAAP
jgi:hypothetical protein